MEAITIIVLMTAGLVQRNYDGIMGGGVRGLAMLILAYFSLSKRHDWASYVAIFLEFATVAIGGIVLIVMIQRETFGFLNILLLMVALIYFAAIGSFLIRGLLEKHKNGQPAASRYA